MFDITSLTKEELIIVIANMHDTILTWDQGWGFNEKDGNTLNQIGNAAVAHTCENNTINNLPNINK